MLVLAARESIILLCRPGRRTTHPSRAAETGALRTLEGPWRLTLSGFHAPEADIPLPKPALWTTLSPSDVAHHAGSGHYHTTLELDAQTSAAGRRLSLDLGQVRELAEVIVNGRSVATCWTPPFIADVTDALRPGINRIEIVVTNTWHNRLVADSALSEAERVTWVSPRLRKREEWLPRADAPLIPSGLAGPVRLLGDLR
jgi:hypothetical protein